MPSTTAHTSPSHPGNASVSAWSPVPATDSSPAASTTGAAISRHARATPGFEGRLHETVVTLIKAAAQGPVVQASSLGAEDMVITHLINTHALPISIFVLDTGALHPETQALLARLQAQQARQPHAPLHIYRPQPEALAQFLAQEGPDAMYRSVALRQQCCGIRKLEPLARALAGQRGWITGLRREQTDTRAQVPLVDHSEQASHQRSKYNPLAHWSWADVWHYIAQHQVPYNPLHDRFYPSIGCQPCTRAITLGEDLRAGRWWWEQAAAKECGLHHQHAA